MSSVPELGAQLAGARAVDRDLRQSFERRAPSRWRRLGLAFEHGDRRRAVTVGGHARLSPCARRLGVALVLAFGEGDFLNLGVGGRRDRENRAFDGPERDFAGGEFDHGRAARGRVDRRAQRHAVVGVPGELGAAQAGCPLPWARRAPCMRAARRRRWAWRLIRRRAGSDARSLLRSWRRDGTSCSPPELFVSTGGAFFARGRGVAVDACWSRRRRASRCVRRRRSACRPSATAAPGARAVVGDPQPPRRARDQRARRESRRRRRPLARLAPSSRWSVSWMLALRPSMCVRLRAGQRVVHGLGERLRRAASARSQAQRRSPWRTRRWRPRARRAAAGAKAGDDGGCSRQYVHVLCLPVYIEVSAPPLGRLKVGGSHRGVGGRPSGAATRYLLGAHAR